MYQKSPIHISNASRALQIANSIKSVCVHCERTMNKANIKRHEIHCYLNPINIKPCPVCYKPIKHYKSSATCGYSCSNTLNRSGPKNGNWKESAYVSTCFHHHKKECVVCAEDNIVEVHHLDENSTNNNPDNLIPLCPTHHQYWHSKFKHIVEATILNYIANWKERQNK